MAFNNSKSLAEAPDAAVELQMPRGMNGKQQGHNNLQILGPEILQIGIRESSRPPAHHH